MAGKTIDPIQLEEARQNEKEMDRVWEVIHRMNEIGSSPTWQFRVDCKAKHWWMVLCHG